MSKAAKRCVTPGCDVMAKPNSNYCAEHDTRAKANKAGNDLLTAARNVLAVPSALNMARLAHAIKSLGHEVDEQLSTNARDYRSHGDLHSTQANSKYTRLRRILKARDEQTNS